MPKIFLAYPISFDCNLHCYYCFHEEHFLNGYEQKRIFTIPQYITFRDTHLSDATEIIVHFHGGETFMETNVNTICAFLRATTMEKADLLTNGIQDRSNYEKIIQHKDRIHRVGFTFHRKIIAGVPSLVKRYEENVLYLHSQGIPVYVKELLFVDLREDIKEAKKYWTDKGISFKVQDFKGCDRGRSHEEFKKYEPEDYLLIDAEYKHGGEYCTCMKGYKSVLIRGGWMDGSVLACFEDPVIVGSLLDNTYNGNYRVYKDHQKGRMDVTGVPKVYKGTWERDLYTPKACGSN